MNLMNYPVDWLVLPLLFRRVMIAGVGGDFIGSRQKPAFFQG
jgi:hypothetical protein